MKNLLDYKFWINLRPGSLTPLVLKAIIIFIFCLAVLAFVFYLLISRKQRLFYQVWVKLYLFSLGNFIIGLFLLFFSYELIPFLSARAWLLLWGIGMIAWLIFVGLAIAKLPKIKKDIAEKNEYEKYIP
ncbi:hypothetical protein DRH27_02680 [Candidatus Falkowbacteria bacterium]|nr:MAG: hypothetical protein DRH27_02680 [Candidatus Falkowbacteria bacterium]